VGMMANDSPKAVDLALESARFFKPDVALLAEEELRRRMMAKTEWARKRVKSFDPSEGHVDLALVFGGDGTILRAARALHGWDVPICGINMGRLGFLSQVEPKDLDTSLTRLVEGRYGLSERMKIDVHLGGQWLGSALNELLIIGKSIGKIFRANIRLGGLGELVMEGDGVIISTPTGSTGHSLSAGGPVVDPGMEALVVTPLGPLTLSRPIIIPATEDVMISPGAPCSLAIDGRVVGEAREGSEITASRSAHKSLFVSFDPDRFLRKLRERIGG